MNYEDLRAAVVITDSDPLAWAYKLKAREVSGHRLTPAQRDAWREALRSKAGTDGPLGQFEPVSDEVLPMGMRA